MVSLAKRFEIIYVIQVGLSGGIHLCAFIQEKLQDKWSWASIVEAVLFALWILLVMVMMSWKIDWIQSKPWVAVAPLILWLGVCGYFKMNALSNGLRILPATVNVVLFPTVAWEKLKDPPRHESTQFELSDRPSRNHVDARNHRPTNAPIRQHVNTQAHHNTSTRNHNDIEAQSSVEDREALSETMEDMEDMEDMEGDTVADSNADPPE